MWAAIELPVAMGLTGYIGVWTFSIEMLERMQLSRHVTI
jgi:diketogulonate reductase-like aldo/keto reductase